MCPEQTPVLWNQGQLKSCLNSAGKISGAQVTRFNVCRRQMLVILSEEKSTQACEPIETWSCSGLCPESPAGSVTVSVFTWSNVASILCLYCMLYIMLPCVTKSSNVKTRTC
ncbi:hypothetical protein LX32DRAFT_284495 [Colletotrichum zoysiae]|uniref:Uncharacterized protein n=1 Tax=Colletotrichum zoysiae TaxID=1216348 RepID=A0AAD9HLE6_9PEZI|nr:hypothetical protein LX32DRAFT_284495 [Colletotrichum zoysiae]